MPEMVALKRDKEFLKRVDETVKRGSYASRTDLIRAALREKMDAEDLRRRLARIDELYGSAKTRTSDEELHRIREKVFLELEKEYGLQ